MRRPDRAERGRRLEPLDRADERIVNAELFQFAVQVRTERVIAGAGDDPGPAAMAGGGYSNVGRRAAKVLAEGRHILQPHPDIVRVDINADSPDREQFVGHGNRGPFFWISTSKQPNGQGSGVPRPRERDHKNYCALEFMSCQRFVLTYLQQAERPSKEVVRSCLCGLAGLVIPPLFLRDGELAGDILRAAEPEGPVPAVFST